MRFHDNECNGPDTRPDRRKDIHGLFLLIWVQYARIMHIVAAVTVVVKT
jgi:hypothetical protein